MNILIIDHIRRRTHQLEKTLTELGHDIVIRPNGKFVIYQLVQSFKPDVVFVNTDSPDRDTLEDISVMTSQAPRPLIIFADDENDEIIRQSIQAGASAYIVDGLQPARIKTLLNVAIFRFEEQQRMSAELSKIKNELADRKIIDKAKGMLMKHKQCDEESAFSAMRNMAMNKNQRLAVVAKDVISLFK